MLKISYETQANFLKDLPQEYNELINFIHQSFTHLLQSFAVYYYDFEGDKIMVKSKEDFELFLSEKDEKQHDFELFVESQNKNIQYEYSKQQQMKINSDENNQKSKSKKKEKKLNEERKKIHEFTTCDGCNIFPIIGNRYKCSVCPNFDYCEKCEATIEHPHPFLKIRYAEQDPDYEKIQNQIFGNDEEYKIQEEQKTSFFDKVFGKIGHSLTNNIQNINNIFSSKKNYDIEITQTPEIQPDYITILTKEIYVKLTLKNTGKYELPKTLQIESDLRLFSPVKVPQLSPDKWCSITLILPPSQTIGKQYYDFFFIFEENFQKQNLKIYSVTINVNDKPILIKKEEEKKENDEYQCYEKASKLENLTGDNFEQCLEFVQKYKSLTINELVEKYYE